METFECISVTGGEFSSKNDEIVRQSKRIKYFFKEKSNFYYFFFRQTASNFSIYDCQKYLHLVRRHSNVCSLHLRAIEEFGN